jgi:hypothetical protein
MLTFLRAEWDKYPAHTAGRNRTLIDHPDLTNHAQNVTRQQILQRIRGSLLRGVPGDTKWYEVKYLRGLHLAQLRAINYGEWISSDDQNELELVALRNPQPPRGSPDTWEPTILWGHERSGLLTVLEGNHRLTALVSAPERNTCALVTFVGLSPSLCIWHLADNLD